MAASPIALTSAPVSSRSYSRRPPLTLSPRRLAANRRNAAHSTGPRTPAGKERVARNAVKHGFFVGPERWSTVQRRDFAQTFDGLCEDFKPQTELEEICVATIADSYVRIATMLRYENIAALKYHRQRERELEEEIAAATSAGAARLREHREKLRRAGLWRPTIPGPRDAAVIIRYEGRLHRAIRAATAELQRSRNARVAIRRHQKVQKQTHFIQQNQGVFRKTAGLQHAASNAGRHSFEQRPERCAKDLEPRLRRHRKCKNKPIKSNVYGQSSREAES